MSPDKIQTQVSIADCRLPDKLSWHHRLNHQLQDFLEPTPTADDPILQSFSLQSARSAFVEAIQSDTSGQALVYRGTKEGYQCEPYIQTSRNRQYFQEYYSTILHRMPLAPCGDREAYRHS